MKRTLIFQLIAAALFVGAVMVMPLQTSGSVVKATSGSELPGLPSDTTVTVTIVKIDLPSNSITLKDGSGKLWNFIVDPQLIDLRKYRVRQKVTATISTTWFTDPVTRARITKIQLLKLQ